MALMIRRVVAHVVEMRVGFSYSSGTLEQARAIIWEIEGGDHNGLGECGFSAERSVPGISMSFDEGSADGLRAGLSPWVDPLIGQDATRLEALLPPMPRELDRDLQVVREGLSIALYDLVGKATGLPVHALLGGARRREIPGMPVIHVGPSDVMVRRSTAWTEAGYRFLKLKFRGELEADVDAIEGIREAVGPDVVIQVDANDGYAEMADAEKAIQALTPLRIDVFEDMLSAPVDRIAELRKRTGARIMVDRQATWPYVHEVVRSDAADVINHHPNNQGGLATALQIDAVATAAGLETAVGSSGLFGIQDAAFQTLSCVVGLPRPCEDIGLIPYYSGPTKGEYPFDGEPSVLKATYPIEDGVICVPEEPGLGIELDRDRLEGFSVARLEFGA